MNKQEVFGFEVMKRFVLAVERDIAETQEHLHYLKEWVRLIETGDPHLIDVKTYIKPTVVDEEHEIIKG